MLRRLGHWECQQGAVQGQSGTTTLLGMTRVAGTEESVSGKVALQINVDHGSGDIARLPTPGIADSLEMERWLGRGRAQKP